MKKICIPIIAFCIFFSFSLKASAESNSKNTNLKSSNVKKVTSTSTNTKNSNSTKAIDIKKTPVKASSKTQIIPIRQIDQISRGTSNLYLSKPKENVENSNEQTTKNIINTNTNVIEEKLSSELKLDTTYIDASTTNDSIMQNGNLQKTLDKSTSSDIITPPNDIIDYAKTFLGVPYVTAGNGDNGADRPYGFDCSGFTKYVFAHFNINIQRRARDQAKDGQAVDLNDLQPGDLVFFGNPIKHVGIYAGNDYYIHSPQTGKVISLSKLSSRKDLYCARRVTN